MEFSNLQSINSVGNIQSSGAASNIMDQIATKGMNIEALLAEIKALGEEMSAQKDKLAELKNSKPKLSSDPTAAEQKKFDAWTNNHNSMMENIAQMSQRFEHIQGQMASLQAEITKLQDSMPKAMQEDAENIKKSLDTQREMVEKAAGEIVQTANEASGGVEKKKFYKLKMIRKNTKEIGDMSFKEAISIASFILDKNPAISGKFGDKNANAQGLPMNGEPAQLGLSESDKEAILAKLSQGIDLDMAAGE